MQAMLLENTHSHTDPDMGKNSNIESAQHTFEPYSLQSPTAYRKDN
jgi:hypothetical protein